VEFKLLQATAPKMRAATIMAFTVMGYLMKKPKKRFTIFSF
jgi:hypothetical protein